MKLSWNEISLGKKLSQVCALLSLILLIAFCIYGAMYSYFDTVVFGAFALSVLCAEGYALRYENWSRFLNLLCVVFLSFGVGLFFLNSFPVWADRLNNITMYNSRGTLFPVISIMILAFLSAIIEIVSCFLNDGKDVSK